MKGSATLTLWKNDDIDENPRLVAGYVKKIMGDAQVPDHHGWEHVKRVVANATKIGQMEGIPPIEQWCLYVAACLHDLGRIAETSETGLERQFTDHATASAQMTANLFWSDLIDWGTFDQLGKDDPRRHSGAIEAIIVAIREHSQEGPATSIVGKILQDADKIDAFGKVGFRRIVGHRTTLSFDEIWEAMAMRRLQPTMDRSQVSILIDQIGYCGLWFRMLNTDSARRIGLGPWAESRGYREILEEMMRM